MEKRVKVLITATVVALLLAACASHTKPEPAGPPDFVLTALLPVPPQARLYADCIAQAAATNSLNRERDGETLRFTCTGAPARAFFDGLGPRSAEVGLEYVADGLTWRFRTG